MPTLAERTVPAPLRRSNTDRLAAGVAGGLGDYYGVDPVLFRVLLVVSSFFGGVGIVMYLIAWAAIPEQNAGPARLDSLGQNLRRWHLPVWLALMFVGAVGWITLFSWWTPWPSAAIIAVTILLFVVLGQRRTSQVKQADGLTSTEQSLDKESTLTPSEDESEPETTRRSRSRARRRRAAGVRWAILAVMATALAVLVSLDLIGGIVLPAYFWTLGVILAIGLLVGAVRRRMPWSLLLLVPLIVVPIIALGGTKASLHDGIGERTWAPTSTTQLASDYRLAIGQATLDLTKLDGQLGGPTLVKVTMACGQIRVIVPKNMAVTINVHIRFGEVSVGGRGLADPAHSDRYEVSTSLPAPAGAVGVLRTIDVHLANGNVDIIRK